jgi:protein-tyrosine phosphatase
MTSAEGMPTGYINFRDLGGHAAPDGHVRYGRVYRSDSLAHCDDADVEHLVGERGIRTVVDLRHQTETDAFPLVGLRAAGVTVHPVSLIDPARPSLLPDDPSQITLSAMYCEMLADAGDRVIEAVRLVGTPGNHPVVFMCSAGKDRTGVLAALLLGLLGVADDAIVADYEATQHSLELMVERARARNAGAPRPELAHLLTADAENIRPAIDWVHAHHGSYAGYAQANGYTQGEIDTLRASLVEPPD